MLDRAHCMQLANFLLLLTNSTRKKNVYPRAVTMSYFLTPDLFVVEGMERTLLIVLIYPISYLFSLRLIMYLYICTERLLNRQQLTSEQPFLGKILQQQPPPAHEASTPVATPGRDGRRERREQETTHRMVDLTASYILNNSKHGSTVKKTFNFSYPTSITYQVYVYELDLWKNR